GQRETTGRNRRARHAELLHQAELVGSEDPVLAQRQLDFSERPLRQIAQQQVLDGRDTQRGSQPLDELTQRSAKLEGVVVLDSAILNADAIEIATVSLSVPA